MDYVIERDPLVSGVGEAVRRQYKKYPDLKKPGTVWLVADQPNAADNIYVCNFDPKSQGFGGQTLVLELVDGSIIELKAPWHTNSEALYKSTGIDVRRLHLTFVVISRDREQDTNYHTVMKDVLYMDEEPMLSSFSRGKMLAQAWADSLGVTVYEYNKSQGGSSNGPAYPHEDAEE